MNIDKVQVVTCQDALDFTVFQSITLLLPEASHDRYIKQAVVSGMSPA